MCMIFLVNDPLQPRTLFQGFWFLANLLFIGSLNYVVNIGNGTIFSFFKLDEVNIIHDKVYFNVAIGSIFFSGGLSFVLFVVQIRKKYVEKVGSDENKSEVNNHDKITYLLQNVKQGKEDSSIEEATHRSCKGKSQM